MPSMNATCSSVHLSNVVDLTLDMCTPNPRCDPLQLVQKNTPNDVDAHLGKRIVHSEHVRFSDRFRHSWRRF